MSQDKETSLWVVTDDVDYMSRNGRDEHPSHARVIDLLQRDFGEESFRLLDCGVMSSVMARDLVAAGLDCEYTGIDISPAVIEDSRARYPTNTWLQMGVCDLEFSDNTFDVVHARHLLECLPYYETAVREMFRVARGAVILCFFQSPREPELLHRRETSNGYIWLNRYAPGPFEDLLRSLSAEVESFQVRHAHLTHRIYLCTLAE